MTKRKKWGDQPEKKKVDIWNWIGAIVVGGVAIWLMWSNGRVLITKYSGETKLATVTALPAECRTGKFSWNYMLVSVDGQTYAARMTQDECLDHLFNIGGSVKVVTHRFFDKAVRTDIEQGETGFMISLVFAAGVFYLGRKIYVIERAGERNREAKRQHYQLMREKRKSQQSSSNNEDGSYWSWLSILIYMYL